MNAAPPLALNEKAKEFWDRHHDRLTAAGILTPADVDSFAVLCVMWGKIAALAWIEPGAENYRQLIQLDRLTKQFAQLARQFGLTPLSRGAKLDGDNAKPAGEFNL